MMAVKLANPGLLEKNVFWNNCGVITYVHDVTNKILSSESNYIVDSVMLPKFTKL